MRPSRRHSSRGSRSDGFQFPYRLDALLDITILRRYRQLCRYADVGPFFFVLHDAFTQGLGLLSQVRVQQPGVADVGAEGKVDGVAEYRDETKGKVEDDVGNHHGVQALRQATIYLGGGANDGERDQDFEGIADADTCPYR